MIFTIEEARDVLRIDGSDNDNIIYPLVSAIAPYLEATTGYTPATSKDGNNAQVFSPIAKTAGQFLLQLWYYGENSDTEKLQRVIDCLLKALSAERGKV